MWRSREHSTKPRSSEFKTRDIKYHHLTTTLYLTLKMTTAEVVETSVTNNSLSEDYPHLDDHAKQITDTPGFKPFTTSEFDSQNNNISWLQNIDTLRSSRGAQRYMGFFLDCAFQLLIGWLADSCHIVIVPVECASQLYLPVLFWDLLCPGHSLVYGGLQSFAGVLQLRPL